MLKYLKTLHQISRSPNFYNSTIVVGNQSADMDSCCTALVTAYLENEINKGNAVPLISIPRDDLRLRRDIIHLFRSLDIDPEWLLFTEDVVLNENSKLFLVDHNAATIPGVTTAILDHHQLEDPELDLSHVNPIKIVKSGSCMSVVINYYSQKFGDQVSELFDKEPILAPLSISPILIDTNNFTKKVEEEDREAMLFLKKHLSSSPVFSPFDSFSVLKKEKGNLDGFTMRDLLRKDYKQWGRIGISSLPKLIEKLVKKGLQDLPNALKRYQHSENLDIMVALASGTSSRTDEYTRQLVYSGHPEFDIAAECPDLELELISEMEGVKFYNQKNTAASRKQIAPQLKYAFQKFNERNTGVVA